MPFQHQNRRLEHSQGRTAELVRDVAAQVREAVTTTKHGWEDRSFPPIDGVRLIRFGSHGAPMALLVQALDGVQPRLLELFCWFSVCSLEEFASLHTSIPLETLMITHATEVIASPESALLARVTTLQLNSCRSLKFSRLPRSLKLRRLILYENEVMDMVCLMAEGTHMLEELEELFLTNSNGIGRRDFEFDQFIASIRKMTHLRVLQLCQQLSERIGIPTFNGFPEALPQTVECLRIWGPLGTITDSDPWVEKVRGKTWLPNLREFALMQDMPTGDHSAWLWARAPWERTDSAGEQTATLDRVSREIIEAMVQYRPQVKITCARH